MKFKFSIVSILFILSFACSDAIARSSCPQEHKSPKQHSIELTTGYPSLIFNLEFPWINSEMTDYLPQGKLIKQHYQPGLNIGYTFKCSRRWEVNVMANIHLTSFDVIQYPELSETDMSESDNSSFD